jgi:hypothetical protein
MKVWNSQMIEDRAFAGDVRINTDKQMIEVYDGKKWIGPSAGKFDTSFICEKVKEMALDELFGVK